MRHKATAPSGDKRDDTAKLTLEKCLARGGGSLAERNPGVSASSLDDQPAALKLASAITLWVVSEVYAEMSQHLGLGPPGMEAMRGATFDAAKRLGAQDRLAAALGERIPGKFKDAFDRIVWGKTAEPMVCHEDSRQNKLDYVAWVQACDERAESELKRYEGTRNSLEARFSLQKSTFDIFVNCLDKGIWVSRSKVHIPLEPRIQRTLVLLLLHRGKGIAPSRVVRWAWPDSSPVIGAEAKKVQSNLKVAVWALKAKLEGVKSFEISNAQPDGSYICYGKCSFCALLPKSMDEKLALLSLRPRI